MDSDRKQDDESGPYLPHPDFFASLHPRNDSTSQTVKQVAATSSNSRSTITLPSIKSLNIPLYGPRSDAASRKKVNEEVHSRLVERPRYEYSQQRLVRRQSLGPYSRNPCTPVAGRQCMPPGVYIVHPPPYAVVVDPAYGSVPRAMPLRVARPRPSNNVVSSINAPPQQTLAPPVVGPPPPIAVIPSSGAPVPPPVSKFNGIQTLNTEARTKDLFSGSQTAPQNSNHPMRTVGQMNALGNKSVHICRYDDVDGPPKERCTHVFSDAQDAVEHLSYVHGVQPSVNGGGGRGFCAWCYKDSSRLFKHTFETHLIKYWCPVDGCSVTATKRNDVVKHLMQVHGVPTQKKTDMKPWTYAVLR